MKSRKVKFAGPLKILKVTFLNRVNPWTFLCGDGGRDMAICLLFLPFVGLRNKN